LEPVPLKLKNSTVLFFLFSFERKKFVNTHYCNRFFSFWVDGGKSCEPESLSKHLYLIRKCTKGDVII
jgi:hypothetical protein